MSMALRYGFANDVEYKNACCATERQLEAIFGFKYKKNKKESKFQKFIFCFNSLKIRAILLFIEKGFIYC